MASAFQVDSSNTTMTATVSEIAQSLFPGASSPTRAQLARSLWVVGSATMVMGTTAAFHLPPAGPILGPAVYYIILVFIIAAAAVEMATAFFLPRIDSDDAPRFHTFVKRLLPFAYIVLLLAVSASGFAIPFKL